MGIAADVASGKSKAPQKQGTGAPAAASNGRPAGSSSGPGKGSKERGTGASPSPAEGAGIRRTTQGNRGAAEPARKVSYVKCGIQLSAGDMQRTWVIHVDMFTGAEVLSLRGQPSTCVHMQRHAQKPWRWVLGSAAAG